MIDFHASEASHARHLLPIWLALEDPGTFTAHGDAAQWLAMRGVPIVHARIPPESVCATVVASFADMGDCRGRPIALVEHGAGQTYVGLDSGGYPGGKGRDPVSLFLCPSQRVADLNSARYPDARTVVVGAPVLDGRWDSHVTRPEALAGEPTVGLSFHWAADFPIPEGRPAWPHYVKALAKIRESLGGRVVGHGHPRALSHYRGRYEDAGIEVVDDFDELCDIVDVYAVDISSTGFEAAARGIPVVWLDSPWYHPGSGHGLRWGAEGWAVGGKCPGPGEVADFARMAVTLGAQATQRALVADALRDVYEPQDDHATARSVLELTDWAEHALPWSERPYRHGRSR